MILIIIYYRISIISIIYKAYAKCLLRRHSINQLIEKSVEYNKDLVYIAFVDFYKAFDSVQHVKIWQALKQQGIPHKIIRILRILYMKSTSNITTEVKGPSFTIGSGVRQGVPLSPVLLCALLEEIFRNIDIENLGLIIDDLDIIIK